MDGTISTSLPFNRTDAPASDPFVEFLTQYVTPHKLALFEQIVAHRTRHFTVVLEDVYQSQNASACVRTCECFGLQDIHFIENEHPLILNKLVVRGASQWLTVHRHEGLQPNTLACLKALKAKGYRIVAASSHGTATPLPEFDVSQKSAFVFGTEKDGLSKVALDHADELLTIPMHGFTESFNLSVAVGICLFDVTHRLRQSNVAWQLPGDERENLRTAWIKAAIGPRLEKLERAFAKRFPHHSRVSRELRAR